MNCQVLSEADDTDTLVGTPSGLQAADDLSLHLLQLNIDAWTSNLPSSWQYSINLHLSQAPNLMNLFIVALEVSRCMETVTETLVHFTTMFPLANIPDSCSTDISTTKGTMAYLATTGRTSGILVEYRRWGFLPGRMVDLHLPSL